MVRFALLAGIVLCAAGSRAGASVDALRPAAACGVTRIDRDLAELFTRARLPVVGFASGERFASRPSPPR
jgi:hypothetical protein